MLYPLLFAALSTLAVAQTSTSCGLAPSGSIRPSIASGYRYQVVATGLSDPRGLAFDRDGNLLVVERDRGRISAHELSDDDNGCVTITSSTDVTPEGLELNHGIAVSTDGNTLYASDVDSVYSWDYDTAARSADNQRTLIQNMTGVNHVSRTLELSRLVEGMLIVSFGSSGNLDILSADGPATGRATVKAFNLTNITSEPYTYQTDGVLLGSGLRNEVGIAEHPTTGGIWGIENGADRLERYGEPISGTNPAEELNFLGYLNGTETPEGGSFFGYPWCHSVWSLPDLPENDGIDVGDHFAIMPNQSLDNRNETDEYCAEQTPPRLVFNAHMAPLDIKFNDSASQLWIAFHGSWNSPDPVGYKLSYAEFDDQGEPVESVNSTTAAIDILTNEDLSVCPSDCFRPATMAIDSRGRIFMSSDSSGEIYMVERDEEATGTEPSETTGTEPGSAPTGGAGMIVPGWCLTAVLGLIGIMMRM